MGVNNAVYDTYADCWWDDAATFDFTSLRYCVNPVRHGYFSKVLRARGVAGGRLLDIGCGGGFLAESFASDGFEVSGIDPSVRSIEAARRHAATSGLSIDYQVGRGEQLPFPDASLDIVACCDVLEHVDDVDRVIGEVARTLKPGGLFLFDTVNRTRRSRFALITVWQDWGVGGLAERDIHVWEKFITPEELRQVLHARRLTVGGMTGIEPRRNPLALAWAFYRIKKGKVRSEDLPAALGFHEGPSLGVSYMGYAVKEN